MKLIEDVGLEVITVTSFIIGGHSVVFWNARYVER